MKRHELALREYINKYNYLSVCCQAWRAFRRSSFTDFPRLCDALEALADYATLLFAQPDGWRSDLGDLAKRADIRTAVSQTARGIAPAQYSRVVDGRKVDLGHHITLRSGRSYLSIHFDIDRDAQKLIIGHMGAHLPNTRS